MPSFLSLFPQPHTLHKHHARNTSRKLDASFHPSENMTEHNSIYTSAPLELGASPTLRLLGLLPDDSMSITCALRIARLDDLPLYTAVSYEWGEPDVTDVIFVDGRPLSVRKNIWNLLARLKRERHQGYLWIDAICIDQSSVTERSHQVALMGGIYSRATDVLCWLGLGTSEIEKAMVQLAQMAVQNPGALDCWKEAFVDGMSALLNKNYWNRVWIVQEFLLPVDLTLRCGDQHITAQTLIWFYEACMNACASVPAVQNFPTTPALDLIRHRRDYHPRYAEPRRGWNMWGLTKISRPRQCTDIRDHLYAMLALLSSEDALRLAIVPDYSKSVADVFTDLIMKELQDPLSIQIYYLPEGLQRMFGLADDDSAVQKVTKLIQAEMDRRAEFYSTT